MSQIGDFIIEDGVLEEYTGTWGHVVIPNGICDDVLWETFASEDGLEEITIPSSLSVNGIHFIDCKNLSRINVDPNNPYLTVDDGILYSKSKKTLLCCPKTRTEPVNIPDSVIEIYDYAFDSCRYLEEINIPNSVEKIAGTAFYACEKLKCLCIPESVSYIYDPNSFGDECGIFSNNYFEEINVSPLNPYYSSYDGVLYGKAFLSSDGVQYGNDLIRCPKNKRGKIAIPKGIVRIDEHAFVDSEIREIICPDSLKTIEDAFHYYGHDTFCCENLRHIFISKSVCNIDKHAFAGCPNLNFIEIDPANPYYYASNGMIFRKSDSACIFKP